MYCLVKCFKEKQNDQNKRLLHYLYIDSSHIKLDTMGHTPTPSMQECALGRDVLVSRRTNVLSQSCLWQNPQRLGLISVSAWCVSSQSRLSRSHLESRAIASHWDVLCRSSGARHANCSCSLLTSTTFVA